MESAANSKDFGFLFVWNVFRDLAVDSRVLHTQNSDLVG